MNFFCEAGVDEDPLNEFQGDDPLWDGNQCFNDACCDFNSPPYFNRILPTVTSDALDVRILLNDDKLSTGDNVLIETIELYVR